jgi:aspergillopepsin I
VYTDVDDSQGFWTFTADGYAIGDAQGSSGSLTGIADTGTTLVLIDDSVVSEYYAQIDGAKNDSSQGGYIFPCSATLPDFSLTIGGETRTGEYFCSALIIANS